MHPNGAPWTVKRLLLLQNQNQKLLLLLLLCKISRARPRQLSAQHGVSKLL